MVVELEFHAYAGLFIVAEIGDARRQPVPVFRLIDHRLQADVRDRQVGRILLADVDGDQLDVGRQAVRSLGLVTPGGLKVGDQNDPLVGYGGLFKESFGRAAPERNRSRRSRV